MYRRINHINIGLRLATAEDIPKLQRLITESVTRLSAGYYTSQQIERGLRYVFGVDTQLILDGTYFVAEAEQEMVGAGGWSKRNTLYGGDQKKGTQMDPLLDPFNEPARIRAFYIHPNWSRRGVGTLILDACENGAREAGFTCVELAATLPGVPFYSSRGYQIGEQIDIPMPGGEELTTFRMTRVL